MKDQVRRRKGPGYEVEDTGGVGDWGIGNNPPLQDLHVPPIPSVTTVFDRVGTDSGQRFSTDGSPSFGRRRSSSSDPTVPGGPFSSPLPVTRPRSCLFRPGPSRLLTSHWSSSRGLGEPGIRESGVGGNQETGSEVGRNQSLDQLVWESCGVRDLLFPHPSARDQRRSPQVVE